MTDLTLPGPSARTLPGATACCAAAVFRRAPRIFHAKFLHVMQNVNRLLRILRRTGWRVHRVEYLPQPRVIISSAGCTDPASMAQMLTHGSSSVLKAEPATAAVVAVEGVQIVWVNACELEKRAREHLCARAEEAA